MFTQIIRIGYILFIQNLFLFSLFAQAKEEFIFKEKICIQDFESISLSDLNVKVSANTSELPEIKFSKTLTSPDLQSNTSLLIRNLVGQKKNPFEIIFKKPLLISDHIIEIEFNIYSNKIRSDLFLILMDNKFQFHTILITHLDFDGWKQIKLPIQNGIYQSDFLLQDKSISKVIGFNIIPAKIGEIQNTENIIVLDDMFLIRRQKYILPKLGTDRFH
ncbi:MAG TPA: hypothetical protein PK079_09605 [Leptospiraceae bacterium]|nr:hypothetical protein [Leptospiraceae bacterium]HMW04561.1 hypothetical protein [Leptospiraceae bacterium]HMX33444.1 hypothetical protein [Leptospiraceae bacterium]HMY30747.1 hypothetical protein [Leptospiraceae bacterium]HMZ64325.1 hypothetical protein [Leptospiraceae bacterium]